MANLKPILLVFSFVCFTIAAIWVPPQPPRFSLIAAGLAFLTASMIF